MKKLSIKLEDAIIEETEQTSGRLQENRYINNIVAFYNKLQHRKLLASELARESRLVQNESMKALLEFEKLED